jgi:hypothetical protein
LKRAVPVLVFLFGAIAPLTARADIILLLDNPNVQLNYNSSIDITGVIENTDPLNAVTIDGTSLVGPLDSVTNQNALPTEATVTDNFTPSNNFPITIAANSSSPDIDFMTVHLGNVPVLTEVIGTYSVNASAPTGPGLTANANFSATRPVPEFSTSAMFLMGPGALALSRLRKTFKRAE